LSFSRHPTKIIAMSATEERNLALVQSLFAAFARGDVQTLLAALTDDVEWILPGPSEIIPFAGVHRGPQAVQRYFVVLNETLEFEKLEAQEFLARDDKVIVLGRSRDRMKSTGRSTENEWAAVITLREGKISRYQVYEDTAALAAALR
jgi:ketosteroid isomerase-like protein